MLPSNDPDSVLVNAFCCFDPSQGPNRIQRFAETLCERFWHAVKSNKSQPNLTSTQRRVKTKSFRQEPACVEPSRTPIHVAVYSARRAVIGSTRVACLA